MSRLVIDASVVLTWCFPDEDAALAEQVADCFKRGDTALVPSFWPHELLNALLAGEKRGRISRELMRSFLHALALLPITLEQFPARVIFDRLQSLGRKHGLTAYNATYLDLAIESGLPRATLDDALIRACKSTGVIQVRPEN